MSFWSDIKKKIKNGEKVSADEVLDEILKSQSSESDKSENVEPPKVEVKPEVGENPKTEEKPEKKEESIKDTQAKDKIPVSLPSYDKITYDAPTDEEIGERAGKELLAYKHSSLAGIDEQAELKKKNLAKAIEDKNDTREQNEKNLESKYDELGENINDDMLRRGLARSSTASLLAAQNLNEKFRAVQALKKQTDDEISLLNSQIEQAEKDRKKAIDNFNIEYAVKYAQRVEELKEEREKKQREATEYNNELESDEYADMLSGLKLWLQLNEQASKNESGKEDGKEDKDEDKDEDKNDTSSPLPDKENNTNSEEENGEEENPSTPYTDAQMYEIFRNHLLSLSPSTAKNAILNHSIYAQNLSTLSYLKLLEEFGR